MEEGVGAAVPDFGLLVLKGGATLILVLALLLLTLYLLRRLSSFRGISGRLRVVEALQVGPKERVVLVALGKRELLLGVTASSIRTLAEFSEEEKEGASLSRPGFADFLSGAQKKKTEAEEVPEVVDAR
ncbi:flagellar biosynthetic protein FliO [Desulfobotulus alkaliphilus]|uniref:Flagellar protein n=1 Tax=Desulfobotulus alkaliphilus TaxID=622671 RepID=A0A562RVI1_9BACT|nr:flagellar biosynthetic protein FliO [Desulfobotulus alkaliphilus]TWI72406.1 flagellar biosynthetic protein FliO [Desulfobotulus alkaliphilus]